MITFGIKRLHFELESDKRIETNEESKLKFSKSLIK